MPSYALSLLSMVYRRWACFLPLHSLAAGWLLLHVMNVGCHHTANLIWSRTVAACQPKRSRAICLCRRRASLSPQLCHLSSESSCLLCALATYWSWFYGKRYAHELVSKLQIVCTHCLRVSCCVACQSRQNVDM